MLRFSAGFFFFLQLTGIAAGPASPEPILPQPLLRVERVPVSGGGELFTYFARFPQPKDRSGMSEIPLVSVLRDTLGDNDPANDRLRQVWAFGYRRPTWCQRLAAGIPFLYRRAGVGPGKTVALAPLLDLAAPAKGTGLRLIEKALQSAVFDPLGATYRTSTRSYHGRTEEYRSMHVWQAVETLRETPVDAGGLSALELARTEGRLVLSNQTLGGLVSERAVPGAWRRKQHEWSVSQGHNWELLRQRAEENGLYFQPLRLGGEEPKFAMLWTEQNPREPRNFDGRFLNIADPYRDSRIRQWQGYSETWDMDGAPARMVPLALYALDHPRVPLVLVDFRDPRKPKRREMVLRVADDITTGVLGLTGFGDLSYFAAKSTWFFVRGRHGAAMMRSARVRAYVQLRQALFIDQSLPAELRAELVRHAEQLGWNPLDEDSSHAERIARSQYNALLSAAGEKLGRELDRAREHELCALRHSGAERFGFRAASVATFGLYRHHDELTRERRELIDMARREAWGQRTREMLAGLPPVVGGAAEARVAGGGGI